MIFPTGPTDFLGLFGGDPFGAMAQTPWRTPGINPTAPPIGGGYNMPSVNPIAAQRPDIFARLQGQAQKSGLDLGALGMALLANSGYSPQKRSFGEILGQSGIQAQQMGRQRQQDELEQRLREAQIRNYDEQPRGPQAPASVQEYEYAKANGFKGSFQDWTTIGGQTSRPSSVQEWEFFNKLGKEDQARYLEMKRNPNFTVKDVAGVQTAIQGMPGAQVQTTPLTTLPQEAAAQAEIAGAKAASAVQSESQAKTAFDLPRVEQNAQQALDAIDKLKKHPGLAGITGIPGKLPVVPGTERAGAMALAEQIQGKTFLEAYNTLKGGGQITEVEGKKAESAIARLNRAQSKEDYTAALSDLESVIKSGLQRARKQAGSQTTGGPTKRVRVDAQGNIIGN